MKWEMCDQFPPVTSYYFICEMVNCYFYCIICVLIFDHKLSNALEGMVLGSEIKFNFTKLEKLLCNLHSKKKKKNFLFR